jgi:Na+/melibiose symporter-like transporter
VGIIALLGALFVIPDLRPGRRHRLDIPGVILASAGLFGVIFGLVEGQRYDWGTFWNFITIPEIIAAGVIVFILFLVYERFQTEPLVPLSLFSNRNFSISIWISAVVAFGLLGFFLPMTILLQSVLGFSALKAGLTFVPMALVSTVVAPVAGRLSDRLEAKWILFTGLTCFAAGLGLAVT